MTLKLLIFEFDFLFIPLLLFLPTSHQGLSIFIWGFCKPPKKTGGKPPTLLGALHPRIINMEPQNEENWKMIVLFQGGSFRFLVGFPGVYYLNPATSPSHVYFLLCFPPQSRDGQKWQNAMLQKLQLGRLQWDMFMLKIINWRCWVAEKIYNILWCIVLKSIFWDTSRKLSTATHFQVLVRVRNDSN